MMWCKGKHLNTVQPNKCLHQPTVRAHSHFKKAIERPIRITVDEPKPTNPPRHNQIIRARSIVETIALFVHPRQRLDQSVLLIHSFATLYKSRTRLLSNATTEKLMALQQPQGFQRFRHPGRAVLRRLLKRSPTCNSFLLVSIQQHFPI